MTTKQKIALYKKFLKVTKDINAFSLPWLANSAQYFCNTYAMIKLSNNFLPVNETVLSVKPDMLAAKREKTEIFLDTWMKKSISDNKKGYILDNTETNMIKDKLKYIKKRYTHIDEKTFINDIGIKTFKIYDNLYDMYYLSLIFNITNASTAILRHINDGTNLTLEIYESNGIKHQAMLACINPPENKDEYNKIKNGIIKGDNTNVY